MFTNWLREGAVDGLLGGAVLYLSDLCEAVVTPKKPLFHPAHIAAHRWRLRGKKARLAGMAMRFPYAAGWGITFRLLQESRARPLVASPQRFAALIFSVELLTMPPLKLVAPLRDWPPTNFALLAIHTYVFAKTQSYNKSSFELANANAVP